VRTRQLLVVVLAATTALSACSSSTTAAPPATTTDPPPSSTTTTSAPASTTDAPSTLLPGMPAPQSPTDVYAADRTMSPAVADAKPLVYVPNTKDNTVTVIDQATMAVTGTFPVGPEPQHVVPSYDLKTLYVASDLVSAGGSLTPIDPTTGTPGARIKVADPYNLYFTPDGGSAIVVAEELKRLDFYDPHTFVLQQSVPVPECAGVDHMDFTADGRTALFSCEFASKMIVLDVASRTVVRSIALTQVPNGKPQDVKLSPDGQTFYVADMNANGVYLIDGQAEGVQTFVPTGSMAHGLYVSRDSSRLFVTNRGEGSVSVIDLATRQVSTKWQIPGGGSPDMGNLSADGSQFWISGRYDGVVYVLSTDDGHLIKKIKVGNGPHGLAVWPQPGRYSLGHTGIMR
jgi:YVTN family beta-propeller protein